MLIGRVRKLLVRVSEEVDGRVWKLVMTSSGEGGGVGY